MARKVLFIGGLAAVATGILSPPWALAAGLLFGLTFQHPWPAASRQWARRLLQYSVVALGFGMNFADVMRAGRATFVWTAFGIAVALGLGWLLGRFLHVHEKTAFLISAGTAICGGSAIAALAPMIEPTEEELAMSIGTVFTLNSIALFLFPAIGLALRLTQNQFGLWAALAIHDTSSVVGAAARFGTQALAVGTVVKLTRALWIIPVALSVAALRHSKAKVQIPWFIALFCLAAALSTWAPAMGPVFGQVSRLGRLGLAVTLFLIGSGITVETVRRAGVKVMLQGVLLWAMVATLSLALIRAGWIGI